MPEQTNASARLLERVATLEQSLRVAVAAFRSHDELMSDFNCSHFVMKAERDRQAKNVAAIELAEAALLRSKEETATTS